MARADQVDAAALQAVLADDIERMMH